jgi:hypothetical protein
LAALEQPVEKEFSILLYVEFLVHAANYTLIKKINECAKGRLGADIEALKT